MNIILLLILLFIPSISNAEYLGCFEPNEAVEIKSLFMDVTGARTTPTSPGCEIFDPDDTVATACTSGTPTQIGSIVGWYQSSHTIPASPLAGTWYAKVNGTIASVVHEGTDTFHVVDTAGDCASRTGVAVSSIGTDVITAASVAAGAITSSEAPNLDAAVSTRLATAGYTAPDNATITTIQSDTNDIQTRIPAALVSGRIDSSVGAIANNAITTASIATGALGAAEMGEYPFTVVSSADCTNSATVFDTNATQTQTDHWKDTFLTFVTGTLAGQTKPVTAYDGATKCMTVKSPGFSTTPTAGDYGIVVNK